MRILKTMPNYRNSFGNNLIEALRSFVDIDIGDHHFWHSNANYDIIHIHWPEHLGIHIKGEAVPPFSFYNNIDKIKDRLLYWKEKNSKIVLTLHDKQTHRYASFYRPLFEAIFQHLDGMIHLGSASRVEFMEQYPQFPKIQHCIIPHGWYDDIPNTITKQNARIALGLEAHQFVLVAFGTIRYPYEEQMLIQAFEQLDNPDKCLLISNGYLFDEYLIPKKIFQLPFLKKIATTIKQKRLEKKRIHWQKTFLDVAAIQYYMNAADLVLIPRRDLLNSGNVPLAYTFKKAVIGPNTGNIGALLQSNGNPIFDPYDINSIVQAIEKAKKLDLKRQGEKNYQYAKQYWNWATVGQEHLTFYKQLAGV